MANELEQASATPISTPVNTDDPPRRPCRI